MFFYTEGEKTDRKDKCSVPFMTKENTLTTWTVVDNN